MSKAFQPEGCLDVTSMYDAIATALAIPDGQRGVQYYLTEAKEMIERGIGHDFAIYALIDALAQDDCSARQWSKIMLAIKYLRKVGK